MKIPNFKNDHSLVPSFTVPACKFKWKKHTIELKQRFYFEDREYNTEVQIFVDGVMVDTDGDYECDLYDEHSQGLFQLGRPFSEFVGYFETEIDDSFGETIEYFVKRHLKSLKEVA